MFAISNPTKNSTHVNDWHAGYLTMMPSITKYARWAFQSMGMEARAEAMQEVLVSSMLAYYRLYQQSKIERAFPSVLARYAVARYRDGRRVGEKMNCRDTMSPYAQRKKGLCVESLHQYDPEREVWREIIVEGKHAGPADTAAARVDFAEWLASLAPRDRQIAEALSDGSSTQEVAKRFQVSSARISQKRRELQDSWLAFEQGQMAAEQN